MPNFKVPSAGLTVLHDRAIAKDSSSKDLPHIIQLNVLDNVTQDILKSIRNNEQVQLRLGKKPLVQYGKNKLTLDHAPDTFPSEVFMGPLDGTEPMYFSGKLSHVLEVQRAKQDTAKSDEALTALENTLKSMKEQQASNEASFVGGKQQQQQQHPKMGAKGPLSTRDRLRGTTTPSSPFLGNSPRLGPTSNPLLSQVPSKDKIRQDAMRIPMVHLLAMKPVKSETIARMLHAPQADCDRVLEKVATDGKGGNKELKDRCFRELDVWKFPYQNEKDRHAAIDRAIHAYDRMRVDKNDQLWQLLLPKEERGKGKVLSRLNFAPPATVTPRLTTDVENKVEASDKETKPKRAKVSTDANGSLHKKKASGDVTVKKKTEKAPTKSSVQPAKADGKFKSSERIEDSDAEAEGVEVAPAKPKLSKVKDRETKAVPSPRTVSQTPINGQHKSKLSNSSAGSNDRNGDKDTDRSHPHVDRTKPKSRPEPERSPSRSRISPRPRVDSSPQKPSPLGSSPPTNSTDLENSSKASTQSSAPSSPPSSTDIPLSQARRTYSPVITGKGRNVSGQTKRKAIQSDEPPAKRQQVHGLGLSKTLTERQQPATGRRNSDSSLSSPEKQAVTKEGVLYATRKFREYYTKYKDLHAKLDHLEPDNRPDEDLDQLWKMHSRLEKLKTELWSDWAKAGGEIAV